MLTFTCFDSHNTNPLTYFDRYTCLQDCYRTRKSKKVGSSLLLYFFKKVSFSSMSTFIVQWQIHQIVSPILNSESTNFSNEYLFWFLFQLGLCNWEKTVLFSFSTTYSNWEKFVEKNIKSNCPNWWNGILLPKLFCLLWEKNVLVIEKNFWNSRLKAKNLPNFWDH